MDSLKTFGIPVDKMPFNTTMTPPQPTRDQHCEHMEQLRQTEQLLLRQQRHNDPSNEDSTGYETKRSGQNSSSDVTVQKAVSNARIQSPTDFDVLLGRGRNYQLHPGNIRFRALIERYIEQYETSDKQDKTILAYTIIGLIKDVSGRFLLRDDDGSGFIEVDDVVAQTKVAHAFRSMRTAMKRKGGVGFSATAVNAVEAAIGKRRAKKATKQPDTK